MARVLGLRATARELAAIGPLVASNRKRYAYPRRRPLPDGSAPAPALRFDPLAGGISTHAQTANVPGWRPRRLGARPIDPDQLQFADLATLAALVRAKRVSCRQLVEASLARLAHIDPVLHCVVTPTAERAVAQADTLDAELAAGHWRGPLHGIPWGAKDLIAVEGYPTTWGSPVWREQSLERDATVVTRLDDAGAVLVAKLSTGELALGDVWFGGKTRNPWDPSSGSNGSSAGSAAAVTAGGVVFAIGTETYGSIVGPAAVCGCSGLRPTFGRVSRHGVMALAWSMDKVGPLARNVADLGPVLAAIAGRDGYDDTVIDQPFVAPGATKVEGWRVGVAESAFEGFEADREVIDDLARLGVDLVPFEPPDLPIDEILFDGIAAEAAASFDELTRSRRLRELANQAGWPNAFLSARFIPAVEYVRGLRLRTELMVTTEQAMEGLDAVVHPTTARTMLALGNLTGRPSVAAPSGFENKAAAHEGGVTVPRGSISFTGQLFGETRLVAIAAAWQRSTRHHLAHPDL